MKGYDYEAFLSYAHGVRPALVDALHAELQRVGRAWYERRARRVFRDEYSVGVAGDLASSLSQALDTSGDLIVLASTAAASSRFVDEEVRHWCSTRDRLPLVVVIERPAGSSTELGAVIPPSLRRASEPWWLDLTDISDEAAAARSSAFVDRVASLAAAVDGVPKDELVAKDLRQYRRGRLVRRIATATLAIVSAVAVVGFLVAVRQADLARARERSATARQLAAESLVLADSDALAALAVARESYRLEANRQTGGALLQLLDRLPGLEATVSLPSAVSFVSMSDGGEVTLAGLADGSVFGVWPDGRTTRLLGPSPSPLRHLTIDRSGRFFTIVREDGTIELSATNVAGPMRSITDPAVLAAAPGCIESDIVLVSRSRIRVDSDVTAPPPPVAIDASSPQEVLLQEDCSVDIVDFMTVTHVDLQDRKVDVRDRFTPAQIGGKAYGGGIDAFAQYRSNEIDLYDTAKVDKYGGPLLVGSMMTTGTELSAMDVSRSGQRLAALYGSTLEIWQLGEAPARIKELRGIDPDSNAVLLDESGRQAVVVAGSRVQWWNIDASSRLGQRLNPNAETSGASARVVDVAFSPTADRLAWIGTNPHPPTAKRSQGDRDVAVMDLADRASTRWLLCPALGCAQIAWLDAGTLALKDLDGGVTAWDVLTGREWGKATWPAPASDGDGKVWSSSKPGVEILLRQPEGFVLRRPGEVDAPLPIDGASSIRFSPDGETFAVAHGTSRVSVYETKTGRPWLSLVGNAGSASRAVAYSPDGGQLAEASAGGGLILWDLDVASHLDEVDRLLRTS